MAKRVFVGSMMIGAKILESLTNAVIDAGGSEEDVRRLETNGGLRKKVAELIAGIKQAADEVVRISVQYFTDKGQRLLSEMISECRFDSVNSDITENHFPIAVKTPVQYGCNAVEMKVFSTEELVGTTRNVTSEEVIQALDKKGYRPAELPEGLAYAKANPDEQRKYPIVILGSVWRHWGGYGLVACLGGWGGERGLVLGWFEDVWYSYCRFLAVRES